MAELAQCLGFDLADPLAGYRKARADLFERMVGALADSEAKPQHLLLTGRQRGEHLPGLTVQAARDRGLVGGDGRLVLDEITEMAVLVVTERRFEGDRLARHLHHPANLVRGQLHATADLLRTGLAAELLHQLALYAHELVDGLDHVHRDADGAGLIGDGAGDGLTDPPRRVGRELVSAPPLELVDGAHEPDVALLDEVEELQPAVHVALGDRHDQPEVGLDQLLFGVPGTAFGAAYLRRRLEERHGREPRTPLRLLLLAPQQDELRRRFG